MISEHERRERFPIIPARWITLILSVNALWQIFVGSNLDGCIGEASGRGYNRPRIYSWAITLYKALQAIGVVVTLNTARGLESYMAGYGRKLRFPAGLGLGGWFVIPRKRWWGYQVVTLRNNRDAEQLCSPAIAEIKQLQGCTLDDRKGMFNVVIDAQGDRVSELVEALEGIADKYGLRAAFNVTIRGADHPEPGMDVMLDEARDEWKAPGIREAVARFGPFSIGIFIEDTPRGLQSMMDEARNLGLSALGVLIAEHGVPAGWEWMTADPDILILDDPDEYRQFLEQFYDLLTL